MRTKYPHPILIDSATKEELAETINRHISKLDFSRYGNEPNYNPAFVTKLNDFHFESGDVVVSIESAAMTGIAPGATENWCGADLSVVARISFGKHQISKATLV